MTRSLQGTSEQTSVASLAAFLALLVRSGSSVEIHANPDGTRGAAVNGHGAAARSVPYHLFTLARDQGMLTDPTGDGLRWVLSRAGRTEVRRERSAGEGGVTSSSGMPVTAPLLPTVDGTESPLSWLRRRKDRSGAPLITAIQYDAGERLRGDLWFAELSPRVTANWEATGSGSRGGGGLGVDMRDSVAAARQRVGRALAEVGSPSAGLLLDVCGHLKGLELVERERGWPPRSGKIVLQIALTALARHYRLPGADASDPPLSARLRHWGVPDYRPATGGGGG